MRRFRHPLTYLFATAIAAGICACGNPDKGKAPFAPPADQTREIFTNEAVSTSLTIASMGMEGTMTGTTKSTILATSAEPGADGAVNLDMTVDYMSMEQAGALIPALAEQLDLNPVFDAVSKGAVGKSFSAAVAPDGSVLNVSNYDGLMDGIVQALSDAVLPETLEANAKEQIETIAKRMYDDTGLRTAVERVTLVRSLEKLDPGITWTHQVNENLGLWPVIATYTFTVAERTDAAITVEEESLYTFNESVPSLISVLKENELVKNFGEPTFEMTGSGTGSYTIDPETGWAVSNNSTADLTGKFIAGPINADIVVKVTRDFTTAPK